MASNRRTFLRSAATLGAAAALPLAPAGVVAERVLGASPPPRPPLHAALLAALGEAVLPESIGRAARAGAVRAFSAWIDAYAPVAEEMHGYGDAEITYTPPDPAPNWNAQLEALDLYARRTRHRGFVALPLAARREVVQRQLARVRGTALPNDPLTAPHVAVALLAHWTSGYAAHDIAYGARIIQGECRGLVGVTRKPLPLAPRDTPGGDD